MKEGHSEFIQAGSANRLFCCPHLSFISVDEMGIRLKGRIKSKFDLKQIKKNKDTKKTAFAVFLTISTSFFLLYLLEM